MDAYFVRVRSKSQFTMGSFYIILCWRLIQTKNRIMQIFTLQILRLLNNLLRNNLYCSCVKTVRLGLRTSRIFVSSWVLGGDSVFAPAISFFLVNTISNSWSSLYDPLRAILLCDRTWLFPVSEMSSHYRCRYLMLDPLRLIDVANHTDLNWIKGLHIPRKVSVYSVYTSTVFNGVYTKQSKVY